MDEPYLVPFHFNENVRVWSEDEKERRALFSQETRGTAAEALAGRLRETISIRLFPPARRKKLGAHRLLRFYSTKHPVSSEVFEPDMPPDFHGHRESPALSRGPSRNSMSASSNRPCLSRSIPNLTCATSLSRVTATACWKRDSPFAQSRTWLRQQNA